MYNTLHLYAVTIVVNVFSSKMNFVKNNDVSTVTAWIRTISDEATSDSCRAEQHVAEGGTRRYQPDTDGSRFCGTINFGQTTYHSL